VLTIADLQSVEKVRGDPSHISPSSLRELVSSSRWGPSISTLIDESSDEFDDSESEDGSALDEFDDELDSEEWSDIDDSGWDAYCNPATGPPLDRNPGVYARETEECLKLLDNLLGMTKYSPMYNERNNSVYFCIPGPFLGRTCGKCYLPQEDVLLLGYILRKVSQLSEKSSARISCELATSGEMQHAIGTSQMAPTGSRGEVLTSETLTIPRDDPLCLIGDNWDGTNPSQYKVSESLLVPKYLVAGVLHRRVDPFRGCSPKFWDRIIHDCPCIRVRLKPNMRDRVNLSSGFLENSRKFRSQPKVWADQYRELLPVLISRDTVPRDYTVPKLYTTARPSGFQASVADPLTRKRSSPKGSLMGHSKWWLNPSSDGTGNFSSPMSLDDLIYLIRQKEPMLRFASGRLFLPSMIME